MGGTTPSSDWNEADWPRILEIENAHNLRDMGGYRAADGRTVKWRTLFRSGQMSRITGKAQEEIASLGIRSICDLRANYERHRRPHEWHEGTPAEYWSRDYEMSVGGWQEMARQGTLRPEDTLEMIHEVYRDLPFEQAESYREMFRRLATGQVPLLFNCSAGKDRTGIAAALVLTALDVPRETIREDYAVTDHAIERLIAIFLGDPKYAEFARLPREQYLPMLRADPTYLDIAFNEILKRCGSIETYFKDVLGTGPAEIESIRNHLLEVRPAERN